MLSKLQKLVEKRRKKHFFIEEVKEWIKTSDIPIKLEEVKHYKILVKIPYKFFSYIEWYIPEGGFYLDGGEYFKQSMEFKTFQEAEEYLKTYGKDLLFPGCIKRTLLQTQDHTLEN
jgi:hypothetical protein